MHHPIGLATDQDGRLFSLTRDQPEVRVFTTTDEVVAGVAGNPFASGLLYTSHGVIHPAGFYMVAASGLNAVGVFAVQGSGAGTTLAPVAGSPFASGPAAHAVAIMPDAKFLVAANTGNGSLTVFRVETSTGGLTFLSMLPVSTPAPGDDLTGLVCVPVRRNVFDQDGDGKADVGVYRPPTGVWYVLQSAAAYSTFAAQAFGVSTDLPVPGVSYRWGLSTDVPVRGDYDGDGTADIAVYRPSTGIWWVLLSSANYTAHAAYAWGLSTDTPVPADYDGDGKTDVAVYRASTGVWWILKSSTNSTAFMTFQWGISTDIPMSRR